MSAKKREFFWSIAEPFLKEPSITRSKLMAFPCLKINGNWFAAAHNSTGNLVAKLPKQRVDQLIRHGYGEAQKSAGRTFKERIVIEDRDAEFWLELIQEARTYAEKLPPKIKR